jgi:hypothetical protein
MFVGFTNEEIAVSSYMNLLLPKTTPYTISYPVDTSVHNLPVDSTRFPCLG